MYLLAGALAWLICSVAMLFICADLEDQLTAKDVVLALPLGPFFILGMVIFGLVNFVGDTNDWLSRAVIWKRKHNPIKE